MQAAALKEVKHLSVELKQTLNIDCRNQWNDKREKNAREVKTEM